MRKFQLFTCVIWNPSWVSVMVDYSPADSWETHHYQLHSTNRPISPTLSHTSLYWHTGGIDMMFINYLHLNVLICTFIGYSTVDCWEDHCYQLHSPNGCLSPNPSPDRHTGGPDTAVCQLSTHSQGTWYWRVLLGKKKISHGRDYRKIPEFSDPGKIAIIILKFELWLYHRVISPKDADRMANNVDLDRAPLGRSNLIWVYIVCPGLSVRKLGTITVIHRRSYSRYSDKKL